VDTKALLLVSGGYDSYVISALCESLCYQTHYLFFNYGQKAYPKEYDAVSRLCNRVNGDSFQLSDKLTEVIINAPWLLNGFKKGDNYFPWRNLMFLSHALSYAETYMYDMVVIGTNSAGDYADSSDTFIKTMEQIYQTVGIKLWSPLQNMFKGDVYDLGKKLEVNFEDTWSCDFSDKSLPCGKCPSCQDTKMGIKNGYLEGSITFLDSSVEDFYR
jgi:7-cyano-7-deazaguanine synthase